MMKTILSTLIFVMSLSATAMDWTGRFEVRDSTTASTMCGAGCSTNSTMGFGAGVTTNFAFSSDWGLYTGGLLRQRVASATTGGTTSSATYLDLDVPVAAQWTMGSFATRAGIDVGLKLSSSYSNITSSAESDNSLITPLEIGFDWSFTKDQLINLTYETGATVAAGQNGANSLATASIITVGYGYTF